MSKENMIIGAIIIAIVLTGGAWYFLTRGPSTPGTETATATTTESAAVTGTAPAGKGTGPLQNVFSRGGNYTCTFGTVNTAAAAASQSSGTLYVAGGKTRGDFSVLASTGTRTTVHIIRSGGTNYTWVDGQTTGTKTAITATTATRINPSGAGFSEDQFATVSWDCHPWLTDSSQFVPPTSIAFVQK